jgi:hypothetical protein
VPVQHLVDTDDQPGRGKRLPRAGREQAAGQPDEGHGHAINSTMVDVSLWEIFLAG